MTLLFFCLCVECNLKDNLVLDWYPSIPVIKIAETDWAFWDSNWGYDSEFKAL